MKKSTFVIFLALVMLLSSFTMLAGAASNLKGDIDSNGKVEAADARFILRASVGLEKISADKLVFADMDKDNKITAADARLTLRASVGLEKQETIGSTITDTSEFSEITVFDNSEILVKVTELVPDHKWGYAIKVYAENKTTDKTIFVSPDYAIVEGLMTYPLNYVRTAPGEAAEDYIYFESYEIEAYNITSFTDIVLQFWIFEDIGEYKTREIATKVINIYPEGKDNTKKYTRTPQKNDKVIFDNEYIKVISTGAGSNDYCHYAGLFIINKTDKELFIMAEKTYLNGKALYGDTGSYLAPNCCTYTFLMWENEIMSQNGISEIKSIDFTLSAEDFYDYSLEPYVTQKISYTP